MSKFNTDTNKSDHSEEIEELRRRAATIKERMRLLPNHMQEQATHDHLEFEAAAAILEVHDMTGLSLDEWAPRGWIEMLIGHPITENHV